MIQTQETEKKFEKHLVSEYFRLGSIDKVIKDHKFSLPISFAGYHRILNKYKVVKSAGPNSKLSESLLILNLVANYKTSLSKIIQNHVPRSIRVSSNTIHRILHNVRLGLTRRQGTALLITKKNHPYEILIGQDISLIDPMLGKSGDYSLPMGHSKLGEDPRTSIIRVLQQEVYTDHVINGCFKSSIVPKHLKPVMFIDIADIKVSVYHLELTDRYTFSSFKLKNLSFSPISNFNSLTLRPGVSEIVSNYQKINKEGIKDTKYIYSDLNNRILAFAKLPTK